MADPEVQKGPEATGEKLSEEERFIKKLSELCNQQNINGFLRDRRLVPLFEKLTAVPLKNHPLFSLRADGAWENPKEDDDLPNELRESQEDKKEFRAELRLKQKTLQQDLRTIMEKVAALPGGDQDDVSERIETFNEELTDFENACLAQGLEDSTFLGYRMALARKEINRMLKTAPAKEREEFRRFIGELQKKLGIGGSLESFIEGFRSIADSAIPEMHPDMPPNKREEFEKLRMQLAHLQYHLINTIFIESVQMMQHMELFREDFGMEAPLKPEELKQIEKTINDTKLFFTAYKSFYAMLTEMAKNPQADKKTLLQKYGLLAAAGFWEALSEYCEERGEHWIPFHHRVPITLTPTFAQTLGGIDWALRTKMLKGYEDLKKTMGNRITQIPKMAEILKFFNKSPFGKEMLQQIFTYESPITAWLMLMYVYSSNNKPKAWAMFASFMATSAMSNALLKGAARPLLYQVFQRRLSRMFARESVRIAQTAPKMAAILKNLSKASRVLGRSPKNFLVQLTVTALLISGTYEPLERFWDGVYDRWEYGDFKQSVENLAAFMSQGSGMWFITGGLLTEDLGILMGPGGELLQKYSPWRPWEVDPQTDAISYLSSEFILLGKDRLTGGPGRNLWHTLHDWNDRLQEIIRREPNPLRKKLIALEMANYGPWLNRHAFTLWMKTRIARGKEVELRKKLSDRGKPMHINLLEYAVSDVGDRNDDQVRAAEVDVPGNKAAKAYIQTLLSSLRPEDRELVALWNEYRVYVAEIAFFVQFFRRSPRVNYSCKNWIGKAHLNAKEDMAPTAMQGAADQGTYENRKRDILLCREKDKETRAEFANHLAQLPHDSNEETLTQIWQWLFPPMEHEEDREVMLSLSAAAEAAALYLPEDHDINALFRDLRERKLRGERITREEAMRIRDNIADELSRYHGSKGRLDDNHAFKSLALLKEQPGINLIYKTLELPQNEDSVFFAADLPNPLRDDFLPGSRGQSPEAYFYEKIAGDFKEDFAKIRSEGKADITLLQLVMPDVSNAANGDKKPSAHFDLMTMRMFCIECAGHEPHNWRVHVFRMHPRRIKGSRTHYRLDMTKGKTEIMSFPQWAFMYHDLVSQKGVSERLDAFKKQCMEEYKQNKETIDAALEHASSAKDTFVTIPGRFEYRRNRGNSEIILGRIPEERKFISHLRPIPQEVPAYTFVTRGEGSHITRTIPSKSYTPIGAESDPARGKAVPETGIDFIHSDNRNEDDQLLMRDVITTPIPGHDRQSLAGILNMFQIDMRFPSLLEIGVQPEYYYTTLLDNLEPMYRAAQKKKFFLERLFDFLYQKGKTIDQPTTAFVTAWFKNNLEIFTKATSAQIEAFDRGDRALSRGIANIWPDENGYYTSKAHPPIKIWYAVGAPPNGWVYKRQGESDEKRQSVPTNFNYLEDLWVHRQIFEKLQDAIHTSRDRRLAAQFEQYALTLPEGKRASFDKGARYLMTEWKFRAEDSAFHWRYGGLDDYCDIALRFDKNNGWIWHASGPFVIPKDVSSQQMWFGLEKNVRAVFTGIGPSTPLHFDEIQEVMRELCKRR